MTQIKKKGRTRTIDMKFIQNKESRWHCFCNKKEQIFRKSYELSTLTGSEILVLLVNRSENTVYAFNTKRFREIVEKVKFQIMEKISHELKLNLPKMKLFMNQIHKGCSFQMGNTKNDIYQPQNFMRGGCQQNFVPQIPLRSPEEIDFGYGNQQNINNSRPNFIKPCISFRPVIDSL